MAQIISVNRSSSSNPISQNAYEKVQTVAIAVARIAFQLIYIIGSILVSAAIFPSSWHSFVIPTTAIGATFTSAFFFINQGDASDFRSGSSAVASRTLESNRLGSLPKQESFPLPPLVSEIFPESYPPGFMNRSQNCAFNALAHFINADPTLKEFFSKDLKHYSEFTDLLRMYQFPEKEIEAFAKYCDDEPNEEGQRDYFDIFIRFLSPNRAYFDQLFVNFEKLQKIYPAFYSFYKSQDEAVQNRWQYSRGDSQKLRVALNRVSNYIHASESVQVDASEIATFLLDCLPFSFHVEESLVLDPNELKANPIVDDPLVPQKETQNFIMLHFNPNIARGEEVQLLDLLKSYQKPEEDFSFNRKNKNGDTITYRVTHRVRAWDEAPKSLRFQFVRFKHGNILREEAFLNRWFPSWFPRRSDYREYKLANPVKLPELLTINLKNGNRIPYCLKSFVVHHGNSTQGGHYTSGEIRGKQKFLNDDHHITLIDEDNPESLARWNRSLENAYLVCYIPERRFRERP